VIEGLSNRHRRMRANIAACYTVHAPCTCTTATDVQNRDTRDDRFSNTYRPRSPRPRSRSPRMDSYRAARSPPRRSSPPPRRRSPPRGLGLASADTYTPGGGSRPPRPRSRSPAFRRRSRSPRRDDNWRARPRSPPRRNFSPRRIDYRNDRPRSPRREGYDSYTRSPRPRDRSPPPRAREASPARSRGVRSPVRPNRYDEPRSRIGRYVASLLMMSMVSTALTPAVHDGPHLLPATPVTTATIDAARPRPGANAPSHIRQTPGAAVDRRRPNLPSPRMKLPVSSLLQPLAGLPLVRPYIPVELLS
jgi:hypothetical protein